MTIYVLINASVITDNMIKILRACDRLHGRNKRERIPQKTNNEMSERPKMLYIKNIGIELKKNKLKDISDRDNIHLLYNLLASRYNEIIMNNIIINKKQMREYTKSCGDLR